MQIDSKDYLVQLESDVSGIIIQYKDFLLQKPILFIKGDTTIGYSHFGGLKNPVWKYVFVSNLSISTCY